MKTVQLTSHNHAEAAASTVEILQGGGVAVVPTDTSYGLAADASNPKAVQFLSQLKGRTTGQPLSVIVSDRAQAERLTAFSPVAAALWERFLPGPLTLVLPAANDTGLVPDVLSPENTLGVRYPDYEYSVMVAERLERPYTATSANRTGQPPAYSVDEFLDSLPENLLPHLVVDAGTLPIRPVSTVVRVSDDGPEVLREGAISSADIIST
jgi:L-threonylcarbamoyladenylate synthase